MNNPSKESDDSIDLAKIQEKLQEVDLLAGKQAELTIKMLLEAALKKNIMPKTALKLGDETMEAIYAQAYNLYNQGKYKESSYIFRLLMLLDFMTPKYTLGVAACLHRLKDYTNAANMYLMCAALEPKNPLPHFHAADCYIQLKLPELALFSVDMAITAAGDQPPYAIIKERATLMKQALQSEVEKRSRGEFEEEVTTQSKAEEEHA